MFIWISANKTVLLAGLIFSIHCIWLFTSTCFDICSRLHQEARPNMNWVYTPHLQQDWTGLYWSPKKLCKHSDDVSCMLNPHEIHVLSPLQSQSLRICATALRAQLKLQPSIIVCFCFAVLAILYVISCQGSWKGANSLSIFASLSGGYAQAWHWQ